ncbi:AMP-binding enzyme C-terminal domain protein [Acididesulfobacillus acetoxydans]|uniref:AMP-binding enzyme C-terminal domain protein n=1 Tax=Acididesulfobacillus acetoxydans TaxID=1561005 RepID=A0A8S0W707_9FIRM|nr:hypothetical protein [Acididesulfobacillus acetoxydans]CAA7600289.1 AMP-binding enzyme C-terminal domain protein [Acididesulfobacillus acetoxydans]CEJ06065.1 AMP-binding, conserved site [Acididesulfobacillus acetoxydans]
MGVCSLRAVQEEMGLIDGRQRDGIVVDRQFVSYFLIESALLEYPGVVEAGAVSDCVDRQDPAASQVLRIFLSLDDSVKVDFETLQEGVKEYIRRKFDFKGPIVVREREKLPMTRSGKIMRTILKEWS